MLYWRQKVDSLAFGVNRHDLLIEVGLDTLVQLQVDVGVLAGQLQTHHNLATLMDPQLANPGSFLFGDCGLLVQTGRVE